MVEAPAGSAPAAYALPRDTLLVRGPDRKSWLDGLVTCSVAAVVPGQAGYGLLLTKQGKIVSDVFLVDSGTELFIGIAPGHGASARALLDRYLVMEDAELEGPLPATAWRLAEAAAAAASVPASGQLQLGNLTASLWVERDLVTPARDAEALAALLAAQGLGVFGVDFGEHDNPHEASLDRIAVSWTKGCYLGQEVVCMQDMRGKVKRRLVALEGPAHLLQAVQGGKPSVLLPDGSVVGQVSSAHAIPAGGARLLASVTSAALEGSEALSVLGESVRVVAGRQALLS